MKSKSGGNLPNEMNITLLEHITELRKRIIYVGLFFVLTIGIGMYITKDVFFFILDNNNINITVHQFSPGDGLIIYMKISLIIGFIFTIPFTLYQVWKFCSPALENNQKQIIFWYVPISFVLLIIGILFAYYVILPRIFSFILFVSKNLNLEDLFGVIEYVNFILRIVFPVSVMFIVPVIVVFLTHLQIVEPSILKKIRKYVYLLFLIISALITPPDLITTIFVATPFILLYEISIYISQMVYNRFVNFDKPSQ